MLDVVCVWYIVEYGYHLSFARLLKKRSLDEEFRGRLSFAQLQTLFLGLGFSTPRHHRMTATQLEADAKQLHLSSSSSLSSEETLQLFRKVSSASFRILLCVLCVCVCVCLCVLVQRWRIPMQKDKLWLFFVVVDIIVSQWNKIVFISMVYSNTIIRFIIMHIHCFLTYPYSWNIPGTDRRKWKRRIWPSRADDITVGVITNILHLKIWYKLRSMWWTKRTMMMIRRNTAVSPCHWNLPNTWSQLPRDFRWMLQRMMMMMKKMRHLIGTTNDNDWRIKSLSISSVLPIPDDVKWQIKNTFRWKFTIWLACQCWFFYFVVVPINHHTYDGGVWVDAAHILRCKRFGGWTGVVSIYFGVGAIHELCREQRYIRYVTMKNGVGGLLC